MAVTPVRKPPVNPEFDPPSSRPLDADVTFTQTNVPPPEVRSGAGGYIIAALVLLLGFALVLYYGSRSDTTTPVTDTTTQVPQDTTTPAVPDTTTTQTAPESTTTTTTTTQPAPDSTSTQTTPEAQAPAPAPAAPAAPDTTTTTQPPASTTTTTTP